MVAATGYAPASARARAGRRFDQLSSPARLWTALLAAVLAVLAVGAAGAATMDARQSTATRTVGTVEPLVGYVQQVYESLADADASAATAILAGQVPPPALTQRFTDDIQQAENSLSAAVRGVAGDPTASAELAVVAAGLPRYTELIGTAQADNRLAYPVGAAYLRDASNYLHGTLLPEVARVVQAESAAETGGLNSLGAPPWILLLVAVLAGAVVVWAWRLTARITRRRINPGLAAAALLCLLVMVWTLAAGLAASTAANTAQGDFTRVSALLQARRELANAGSDQALTLVERGEDNGTYAQDEKNQVAQIASSGALDGASRPLFAAFRTAAGAVSADVAAGDYVDGITGAVGTGSANPGTLGRSTALDAVFARDAAAAQSRYTSDGAAAGNSFTGGMWGTLVVAVAAGAAVIYGLNRRLAEYR